MQILSVNFSMYTIGGVWRPIEWSSTRFKLLYNLFTFLIIFSLICMMLAQFLNMIFIVDNMEDYITVLMLSLSIVSAVVKAIAVITRRNHIINIIQLLQEKPCKACTKEEIDIQMKFDRFIRSRSICYMILVIVSVTSCIIAALLDLFLEDKLPFYLWIPYVHNSCLLLRFISLYVIIIMVFIAFIPTATETSVLGFCLQMCAQFEILKHRLQRMVNSTEEIPEHFLNHTANKSNRLSEHICHHLSIIRIAKIFNDVFGEVIFIQFFSSLLIICMTLYYISSNRIKDVILIIVYAISMFVQIYIYCWAGNEVMFQSMGLSEAVYQIDWTMMTIDERKDLLMIMKRCTRPIKLTSSFLVTLSLESYANLLKASYSVFSILQQS